MIQYYLRLSYLQTNLIFWQKLVCWFLFPTAQTEEGSSGVVVLVSLPLSSVGEKVGGVAMTGGTDKQVIGWNIGERIACEVEHALT